MASTWTSALAALGALLFFSAVGLPVARRLLPDRSLAFALAPTLGSALFMAASLPILCLVGFGAASVGLLAGGALIASFFVMARSPNRPPPDDGQASFNVPRSAYVLAALCAAAPMIALLPKETATLFLTREAADPIYLAAPIFDHSKVAIVEEIARNGVPAQNPFYGSAGEQNGLAYYYLWHFSAAMLSLVPGVSGWEADVALTGFTAFATLSLMMGLAVRVAERSSAAFWALALSLAASGRPALNAVFGPELFGTWLSAYAGLGTVMVQATWAPQHVAAAACVVLATLLIQRLAAKPEALTAIALGLVAAAGFGSSVWIGAFVFAPAGVGVATVLLIRRDIPRPVAFAIAALAAALIAVGAAAPILAEQLTVAANRPEGLPLAFHPYEVLGPRVVDAVRRALDLPAYWTMLLPIDFPAIYPAGLAALAVALFAGSTAPAARRFAALSAFVALAAFGVAWLMTSTLLNNDLGWRAVLPGAMVLTVFAAAGLARWTARPFGTGKAAAAIVALALFGVGLADGLRFMGENAGGLPSQSAQAFGRSPALWAAVRRHSGPTERIANNPASFAEVTHWPINISWALLADRRSCYAGWEFARPFAPLPKAEIDDLDQAFRDVFAGKAPVEAAKTLFARHDCRLAVVTAMDGAWAANAFAADPAFELLEQAPNEWRVYRFTPSAG